MDRSPVCGVIADVLLEVLEYEGRVQDRRRRRLYPVHSLALFEGIQPTISDLARTAHRSSVANRFGAIYLVILGIANLIEAPLYLGFFPKRPELLYLAVAMRTICLAVLALHCLDICVGFGNRTRISPFMLRRLSG